MANFDDLVKKAKLAHLDETARKDEEYRRKKEARNAFVDASVTNLETMAMPVLSRAVVALRGEGVISSIDKRYDVKNRADIVLPSLIFKCASPPRHPDGYTSYSAEAHIEAKPELFKIKIEPSIFGSAKRAELGHCQPTEFEEFFSKAFEIVLANYYQMVKDSSRTG